MNTKKETDPAAQPSAGILMPLLNREGSLPDDGFYHIVALGDHPLRVKDAGGTPQKDL